MHYTETFLCCIYKKCAPYFCTLDNSCAFVFGIFVWLCSFFLLRNPYPAIFWSRCESACAFSRNPAGPQGSTNYIFIVFVNPYQIYQACMGEFASTLLSCRKCPHARMMFTSLVVRYHAQFLSPKNLVAYVLSRLVPAQDGLFALILWYVAKTLFRS